MVGAATMTACSSEPIDVERWKSELAAQGVTPPDWGRFQQVITDSCDNDVTGLNVAFEIDGGIPLAVQEINWRNGCPDRLDDFEDAVREFHESKGAVDLACDTPASERSQEQRNLAEAMGC